MIRFGKFAAALLCLLLLSPRQAVGQSFDKLVVFGDSLSDVGNVFAASGHTDPPSPPYDNGRYSNGPIWVEYLAPKLGLTFDPANDFAYGGATTGTGNLTPGLPGIQTQVSNYLLANPVADPKALYIVWGGADDFINAFLNNQPVNLTTPLTNLAGEVSALAAHGARNFLVPDLPDLGAVPAVNGNPVLSALAHQLTVSYNAAFAQEFALLQQSLPGDHITTLDVAAQTDQILADPAAFGFTNVTDSYLANGVGDPNHYLFFDIIHPTTAGHKLLADLAAAALVPEPGAFAFCLSLVVCGSVIGLRRSRRRTASAA